jgi:hypothetical protein
MEAIRRFNSGRSSAFIRAIRGLPLGCRRLGGAVDGTTAEPKRFFEILSKTASVPTNQYPCTQWSSGRSWSSGFNELRHRAAALALRPAWRGTSASRAKPGGSTTAPEPREASWTAAHLRRFRMRSMGREHSRPFPELSRIPQSGRGLPPGTAQKLAKDRKGWDRIRSGALRFFASFCSKPAGAIRLHFTKNRPEVRCPRTALERDRPRKKRGAVSGQYPHAGPRDPLVELRLCGPLRASVRASPPLSQSSLGAPGVPSINNFPHTQKLFVRTSPSSAFPSL